VQVRDVAFLRAHTEHEIKITVPGAFTMARWRWMNTTAIWKP
jgi:5-methyltetrahydropteroyltriglutamate--homocysteine methyltransferase